MNPRELEDKLERDNLTLKEHIQKLQETIKQIKSEISSGNDIKEGESFSNYNNLNNKNNKKLNISNKINTNVNSNINLTKKSSQNNSHLINDNSESISDYLNHIHNREIEEDSSHLKFSFNNENNNKNEINSNINLNPCTNESKEMKKHIYHDNFDKIRKEKEVIDKIEKMKKTVNLKKKYSDGEDEDEKKSELYKFHQMMKVQKNNGIGNKNTLTAVNRSDDEMEDNPNINTNKEGKIKI
jgi:hypothetical protein